MEWINCDSCNKWIHVHCELKHNPLSDLARHKDDPQFQFQCPPCRRPKKREQKAQRKATVRKLESMLELRGQ